MLIIGIDDSGRGPLIGPMVLAGALLKVEDEPILKKAGVKDSKLLTQEKRLKLHNTIIKTIINHKVVFASPDEIDKSLNSGINLNTVEAIKTAEIINYLNDADLRKEKEKIKIIIDCPSPNIKAWRAVLLKYIQYSSNLDVICEHKADFNYPSVSAASILAKLAREEEVAKIKEKFGETGSGYLTDPLTQKFLSEHGKRFEDSGLFRKSWVTWANYKADKEQKKLFLF